jgi:hypothetical protein
MRGDYENAVQRRRRTLAAASFGGIADPFFSSVKFLLHMEGADASTAFTDSGPAARTFTAAGDAQIDTGIAPPFGSASGLFDGTGDVVSTPSTAAIILASSDWTLETMFNRAGGSGARRTMVGEAGSSYTAAQTSVAMELSAANVVNVLVAAQPGSGFTTVTGTTAFTSAGWHHAAVERAGNFLKLFVDGVQEGGDVAFSGVVVQPASGSPVWALGRPGSFNGLYWNGSLKETRLTVGTARYAGNFAVPTTAFPDR